MPRRRLGGAAFVFLWCGAVVALASCATGQLSGLTRDEKIAYLILNDQLATIRGIYTYGEPSGSPGQDSMPVACVRVGVDSMGRSVDPSAALLEAIREAERAEESAIKVDPASSCNDDSSGAFPDDTGFRENDSGRSAILVDTNALSVSQGEPGEASECKYPYSGAWFSGGSVCLGLCLGFSFYAVRDDGNSMSLERADFCNGQ
jgi:hypothetical protein